MEMEKEAASSPPRADSVLLLALFHDALLRSRPILLSGAAVVSMDQKIGDLPRGDVLLRDGLIAAVGGHIDAGADFLRVDLTGTILMPGLVDAHRHCWQGQLRHSLVDSDLRDYVRVVHETLAPRYSPEDVEIGTLVSLLASLNAGVTTFLDFAHNSRSSEHSDAAFRSYAEAGVRVVHAHAAPRVGESGHWPGDALRLRAATTDLVSVQLGLYTPQLDRMAQLVRYARDHSLRIAIDAVAGPTGSDLVAQLARAGCLGPHIALIHCAGLDSQAWRAIADTGTNVILAPTSDALIGMGDGSTPVAEAISSGVPVALSTDVETALSGDMFNEMRAALFEQRRRTQAVRDSAGGEIRLPARAVLELATIGGAHVLGLAYSIGSISPGKSADLVVLRGDSVDSMPMNSPVATAVLAGHPGIVDTVLVGGAPRKWGVDSSIATSTAFALRSAVREISWSVSATRTRIKCPSHSIKEYRHEKSKSTRCADLTQGATAGHWSARVARYREYRTCRLLDQFRIE